MVTREEKDVLKFIPKREYIKYFKYLMYNPYIKVRLLRDSSFARDIAHEIAVAYLSKEKLNDFKHRIEKNYLFVDTTLEYDELT